MSLDTPRDQRKALLFADEPARREGSIAFCLSKPALGFVRVTNIRVDDWGVKLQVIPLNVPGLDPAGWRGMEVLEFSGGWEHFLDTDGHWSWYYYGGWELHFDTAIIVGMMAVAQDASNSGDSLDYYAARPLVEKAGRAARTDSE